MLQSLSRSNKNQQRCYIWQNRIVICIYNLPKQLILVQNMKLASVSWQTPIKKRMQGHRSCQDQSCQAVITLLKTKVRCHVDGALSERKKGRCLPQRAQYECLTKTQTTGQPTVSAVVLLHEHREYKKHLREVTNSLVRVE